MIKVFSLKDISENLGLISITILIGTLVRLYVYYFRFGINILSMIELSEIPKYSVDIFVIGFVLIVYIFSIVAMFFIGKKKKELSEEEMKRREEINPKDAAIRPSIFMIGSMLIAVLLTQTTNFAPKMIYMTAPALILYAIYLLVRTVVLGRDEELKEKYGAFYLAFIFTSIMSIYIGCASIEIIFINKVRFVMFKYEERIIESTPLFYCVGSTNKYYFMYNEEMNASSIFEKDKMTFFSTFGKPPRKLK